MRLTAIEDYMIELEMLCDKEICTTQHTSDLLFYYASTNGISHSKAPASQ